MEVLYYFLVLVLGLIVGALLRNEAVKEARAAEQLAHGVKSLAMAEAAHLRTELNKLRLAIAKRAKLKK